MALTGSKGIKAGVSQERTAKKKSRYELFKKEHKLVKDGWEGRANKDWVGHPSQIVCRICEGTNGLICFKFPWYNPLFLSVKWFSNHGLILNCFGNKKHKREQDFSAGGQVRRLFVGCP